MWWYPHHSPLSWSIWRCWRYNFLRQLAEGILPFKGISSIKVGLLSNHRGSFTANYYTSASEITCHFLRFPPFVVGPGFEPGTFSFRSVRAISWCRHREINGDSLTVTCGNLSPLCGGSHTSVEIRRRQAPTYRNTTFWGTTRSHTTNCFPTLLYTLDSLANGY